MVSSPWFSGLPSTPHAPSGPTSKSDASSAAGGGPTEPTLEGAACLQARRSFEHGARSCAVPLPHGRCQRATAGHQPRSNIVQPNRAPLLHQFISNCTTRARDCWDGGRRNMPFECRCDCRDCRCGVQRTGTARGLAPAPGTVRVSGSPSRNLLPQTEPVVTSGPGSSPESGRGAATSGGMCRSRFMPQTGAPANCPPVWRHGMVRARRHGMVVPGASLAGIDVCSLDALRQWRPTL